MTNKRFTQEEVEKAGSTDLVSLLESQGETLKREGKSYAWMDNGQKVSVWGNRWFHQYERTGGNAIDFVRRYFNKSFIEAVDYLLDGKDGEIIYSNIKPQVKVPFKMPPRDEDISLAIKYLTETRCINKSIVKDFVDKGLIYQTSNKGYKNVVFVGLDEAGMPKHANMRGINGSFKGNPASSNDRYVFHWNGTSDRVYLFESPIDMLSYISLNEYDWKQHTYISACGVSDMGLMQCLENNPGIDKIYLCLDNDKPGQLATERILSKLIYNPYYTCEVLVPESKDWNEDLISLQEGEDVGWTPTMQ